MTVPNVAPDWTTSDKVAPICLRVDLAMRMLGIGKTKLYHLIAAGELETVHIGRRTLILQASIDAMIDRLRGKEGRKAEPGQ
jgi:excisionase family DNA binding protein